MTIFAGEERAEAGITAVGGETGIVVVNGSAMTTSTVQVILGGGFRVETVLVFGDRDRLGDFEAARRRRQAMAARARERRTRTAEYPDDPEVAAEQAAVARALREAQVRAQVQT